MAITVSPIFSEGSDGEVLTDFQVQQHQELHRGSADQDTDYFQDEYGVTHHRYADLDPERVQEIVDQSNSVDDLSFNEADTEPLMDLVGGQDAYEMMTRWAAANLPQDLIDQYDAIIDNGDINDIEEAMLWLEQQFHQYGGEFEVEEEISELKADVLDVYPEYDEMVAWARELMTEEAIIDYDSVMDSGDRDQIASYINQLAQAYYLHQSNDNN